MSISSRGAKIPEPIHVQRGTDCSFVLDFNYGSPDTGPNFGTATISARIYTRSNPVEEAAIQAVATSARQIVVTIPVAVSSVFVAHRAELELTIASSGTRIDNPIIADVLFFGANP